MFPRMLYYLLGLRRNLRLKPSDLRDLQLRKFRFLLRYAYDYVAFYHRKFRDAGIKPDDIKSFSDLVKIPLVTKSEIQSCSPRDIVAKNFDVDKCIKRTTSGSTGIPLTIFVDRKILDFEEALLARAYLENGLRLRDKMAVVSDPRSFPRRKSLISYFGILRRRYISIFDGVERQLELLEKFKPDVIKGYSSSITILANAYRNIKQVLKPRLIFTSAEVLDNVSKRLIESAFEAEVFDNYACYEFGPLAWECSQHEGYHINVDSVLMEFVKDGDTVSAGERGEIVCTSLSNFVMPLIRYRTGDIGVPSEEICSCGRSLPLMKSVEGRADDYLVTADGEIISPTVFFPYPFELEDFDAIAQFRIIQEERDKLIIQLAVRDKFQLKKQAMEKAESKLRQLFGEGIRVDFQVVKELEKDPSGKLRKVVSKFSTENLPLKR